MVKIELAIVIILLNTLFVAAAEPEYIKATITDNSGESTSVFNLNLSNWHTGKYWPYDYEWSSYDEIRIIKGASEINVPFKNIKYLEYNWNMNPPEIEVMTSSGDIIKGQPLRIGENWYFRGQTEYGNFKIITNNTKRIELIPSLIDVKPPEESPLSSEISNAEKHIESDETQNSGSNNIINNIVNNINNYLNNSGNTNYTINNNFILEIVLFTLLSIAAIKYVPEVFRKRKKSPPK